MDILNEKTMQLEEELYESKTIQSELLEELKKNEESLQQVVEQLERFSAENEKLLKKVEDAEFRAEKATTIAMCKIYHAKTNDEIDKVLGNYLNTYPEQEKLKIMFLRESEGVYHFGQRRVYIKVEKGNTILLRVGGGFMQIGEFIDKYTALEQEKIERKDVIGNFMNKLSVQKLADFADGRKELSPIRQPRRARSPMK